MLSERRIVQVVGEQVVFAQERISEYRNNLVVTLVNVVRVQDEGFSDRRRKKQVKQIIEELGAQVLTQQQESE
ncbi:MAG: hypothetical protein OXC13_19010 [Caldilineaceae bacterium]|nr:hypothetical protein [Caldilineaceae bacterium]